MRTPEDRLKHDVENGINRHAAYCLRYCGETGAAIAKTLLDESSSLRNEILDELRVRWTIIERPRKQKTLRQES